MGNTWHNLGTACVLATMALSTAACGDDPPPQPPPQPLPVPPPVPAPVEPPPPPAPTVQTGPCNGVEQVAMRTAIKARGKDVLIAGMKEEATAFKCEHVADAGSISMPITLSPGKCYSFMAVADGNITDLDVKLTPNLGGNANPLLAPFAGQSLAQDSETGPFGSIGGKPSCFKNPFPVAGPAMVTVTAKAGHGKLAVQTFVK